MVSSLSSSSPCRSSAAAVHISSPERSVATSTQQRQENLSLANANAAVMVPWPSPSPPKQQHHQEQQKKTPPLVPGARRRMRARSHDGMSSSDTSTSSSNNSSSPESRTRRSSSSGSRSRSNNRRERENLEHEEEESSLTAPAPNTSINVSARSGSNELSKPYDSCTKIHSSSSAEAANGSSTPGGNRSRSRSRQSISPARSTRSANSLNSDRQTNYITSGRHTTAPSRENSPARSATGYTSGASNNSCSSSHGSTSSPGRGQNVSKIIAALERVIPAGSPGGDDFENSIPLDNSLIIDGGGHLDHVAGSSGDCGDLSFSPPAEVVMTEDSPTTDDDEELLPLPPTIERFRPTANTTKTIKPVAGDGPVMIEKKEADNSLGSKIKDVSAVKDLDASISMMELQEGEDGSPLEDAPFNPNISAIIKVDDNQYQVSDTSSSKASFGDSFTNEQPIVLRGTPTKKKPVPSVVKKKFPCSISNRSKRSSSRRRGKKGGSKRKSTSSSRNNKGSKSKRPDSRNRSRSSQSSQSVNQSSDKIVRVRYAETYYDDFTDSEVEEEDCEASVFSDYSSHKETSMSIDDSMSQMSQDDNLVRAFFDFLLSKEEKTTADDSTLLSIDSGAFEPPSPGKNMRTYKRENRRKKPSSGVEEEEYTDDDDDSCILDPDTTAPQAKERTRVIGAINDTLKDIWKSCTFDPFCDNKFYAEEEKKREERMKQLQMQGTLVMYTKDQKGLLEFDATFFQEMWNEIKNNAPEAPAVESVPIASWGEEGTAWGPFNMELCGTMDQVNTSADLNTSATSQDTRASAHGQLLDSMFPPGGDGSSPKRKKKAELILKQCQQKFPSLYGRLVQRLDARTRRHVSSDQQSNSATTRKEVAPSQHQVREEGEEKKDSAADSDENISCRTAEEVGSPTSPDRVNTTPQITNKTAHPINMKGALPEVKPLNLTDNSNKNSSATSPDLFDAVAFNANRNLSIESHNSIMMVEEEDDIGSSTAEACTETQVFKVSYPSSGVKEAGLPSETASMGRKRNPVLKIRVSKKVPGSTNGEAAAVKKQSMLPPRPDREPTNQLTAVGVGAQTKRGHKLTRQTSEPSQEGVEIESILADLKAHETSSPALSHSSSFNGSTERNLSKDVSLSTANSNESQGTHSTRISSSFLVDAEKLPTEELNLSKGESRGTMDAVCGEEKVAANSNEPRGTHNTRISSSFLVDAAKLPKEELNLSKGESQGTMDAVCGDEKVASQQSPLVEANNERVKDDLTLTETDTVLAACEESRVLETSSSFGNTSFLNESEKLFKEGLDLSMIPSSESVASTSSEKLASPDPKFVGSTMEPEKIMRPMMEPNQIEAAASDSSNRMAGTKGSPFGNNLLLEQNSEWESFPSLSNYGTKTEGSRTPNLNQCSVQAAKIETVSMTGGSDFPDPPINFIDSNSGSSHVPAPEKQPITAKETPVLKRSAKPSSFEPSHSANDSEQWETFSALEFLPSKEKDPINSRKSKQTEVHREKLPSPAKTNPLSTANAIAIDLPSASEENASWEEFVTSPKATFFASSESKSVNLSNVQSSDVGVEWERFPNPVKVSSENGQQRLADVQPTTSNITEAHSSDEASDILVDLANTEEDGSIDHLRSQVQRGELPTLLSRPKISESHSSDQATDILADLANTLEDRPVNNWEKLPSTAFNGHADAPDENIQESPVQWNSVPAPFRNFSKANNNEPTQSQTIENLLNLADAAAAEQEGTTWELFPSPPRDLELRRVASWTKGDISLELSIQDGTQKENQEEWEKFSSPPPQSFPNHDIQRMASWPKPVNISSIQKLAFLGVQDDSGIWTAVSNMEANRSTSLDESQLSAPTKASLCTEATAMDSIWESFEVTKISPWGGGGIGFKRGIEPIARPRIDSCGRGALRSRKQLQHQQQREVFSPMDFSDDEKPADLEAVEFDSFDDGVISSMASF